MTKTSKCRPLPAALKTEFESQVGRRTAKTEKKQKKNLGKKIIHRSLGRRTPLKNKLGGKKKPTKKIASEVTKNGTGCAGESRITKETGKKSRKKGSQLKKVTVNRWGKANRRNRAN